jgi:hypothetical protein
MKHISGNGEYDLEIVGESHYQSVLVKIAGPHTKAGRRVECAAVLYLQPDNPHDPNAVRVEIQGSTVGYIARELAPIMRQELGRLGIKNGDRVGADAVILGGRIDESYGVWLDVPMNDDDADEDYDDEEDDEDDLPAASSPPPVIKPTVHGAKKPITWEEEKATRYVPPPPMKNGGVPGWAWSLLIVLGLLGGCVALSTLGR